MYKHPNFKNIKQWNPDYEFSFRFAKNGKIHNVTIPIKEILRIGIFGKEVRNKTNIFKKYELYGYIQCHNSLWYKDIFPSHIERLRSILKIYGKVKTEYRYRKGNRNNLGNFRYFTDRILLVKTDRSTKFKTLSKKF